MTNEALTSERSDTLLRPEIQHSRPQALALRGPMQMRQSAFSMTAWRTGMPSLLQEAKERRTKGKMVMRRTTGMTRTGSQPLHGQSYFRKQCSICGRYPQSTGSWMQQRCHRMRSLLRCDGTSRIDLARMSHTS